MLEIRHPVKNEEKFEIHLVHLWKVDTKTALEWKYQLLYYVQTALELDPFSLTMLLLLSNSTEASQPYICNSVVKDW